MGLFTDEDRLKSVTLGQEVISRYGMKSGIRCVVVEIHNNSVKVKNQKKNFETWLLVTDLYPFDQRVKDYSKNKIKKPSENNNLSSDFNELIETIMSNQG